MSVMQPLRDEHADLLPSIDRLRAVADAVGELGPEELRETVSEAHRFLTEDLIPHAEAEDAVLYPVVERVMGAAGATATMTRDHVEVARLADELGALAERLADREVGPEVAKGLRRVLYGLHALVAVHFAKEEEVYVPLLERGLAPEEARHMLGEMHGAAHAEHAAHA